MAAIGGEELTIKRFSANSARALLFVALFAVLAYIQLPWPTYPSTLVSLQSVGVFIAAILLGPVWGSAAVVVLFIAGALGLPVFHGGSGIEFLVSTPKSGYLFAYLPVTILIGYLVHEGRTVRPPSEIPLKMLLGAIVSGIVLMIAAVTIWYAILKNTGVSPALLIAPLTYLPLEILKIGLVVGVIRADLLVPN